MRGVRDAVLMAMVLGSAACSDLPEIRYETQHLRIAPGFDSEVCQGSIDHLEDHVSWVEEALGVELSDPVEVYWSQDLADANCPEEEGNDVVGCYDRSTKRVFTTWGAAPHELVHAVAGELGGADEFFSEGTASAFDGEWTRFGFQAPTLGVGLEREDVQYGAAAHFIRWLYERDGAGPLRELLSESSWRRGPSHADKAFEKAYGRSLLDAEREFYSEAPERYPGLRQCQFPDLDWDGDRLDAELELDCAESSTFGTTSRTRKHTITIPTDDLYVLEVEDPAELLVRVCIDDVVPIDEPWPDGPPPPAGEMPGSGYLPASWIDPGVHELYLFAGRYQVDVRLPEDGRARFRLHAKLSGGPPKSADP